MFWDLVRRLWMRGGARTILGQCADDFAGGVEKLEFGRAVRGYAKDEAITAFGVLELKDGAAVTGASENDARMIAGVGFNKLFELGGLLIFGELRNAR